MTYPMTSYHLQCASYNVRNLKKSNQFILSFHLIARLKEYYVYYYYYYYYY